MSYSKDKASTPEHKEMISGKAKAHYQKRQAEWRAAGLCPSCGHKPPASDRKLCEDCLESRRLSARRQSVRLRGPLPADALREERIRANDLISRRNRVAKARSLGLCVNCHKRPSAPRSKSLCEPCLTARNIATRARVKLIKSNPDIHSTPFDCGICDKRITFGEMKLDHCHATHRIRGYLCNRCNLGLGYFQDSIPTLRKAITYMEDFYSGANAKPQIIEGISEW